jgi:hypothetical protein
VAALTIDALVRDGGVTVRAGDPQPTVKSMATARQPRARFVRAIELLGLKLHLIRSIRDRMRGNSAMIANARSVLLQDA